MRVVLASNSPRRKELVGNIIKDFEIIPSEAEDDSGIKEKIKDPIELVERLSIIKAKDIFNKEQSKAGDLMVIGGDTIVYLDRRNIRKAKRRRRCF